MSYLINFFWEDTFQIAGELYNQCKLYPIVTSYVKISWASVKVSHISKGSIEKLPIWKSSASIALKNGFHFSCVSLVPTATAGTSGNN